MLTIGDIGKGGVKSCRKNTDIIYYRVSHSEMNDSKWL